MKVYEKVRAYIDKMQFEQGFVAKKSGISNSDFKAIMNGKKQCTLTNYVQYALR